MAGAETIISSHCPRVPLPWRTKAERCHGARFGSQADATCRVVASATQRCARGFRGAEGHGSRRARPGTPAAVNLRSSTTVLPALGIMR
jgi:hypothetical protein